MAEKKFDYFINGEKGKWEVIIGLEVHAQVLSKSKLFSSSSTKFGAEPNTQVSLVDSAFPGMLPVINQFCVEQSIKTGLGLKAKINLNSVFDRKNYFYADLPQGYQISQYKKPLVGEGEVILDMPYGTKKVGIERLHLEQDAGKSIHDIDPDNSFVDLNRSGKLRSIMRYLGTCDGNMQEGSLRADVNVSVRKVGDSQFGTRCEIKNVNSIKFMQMAIEYEAKRQVEILESGKKIDQETRLFDVKKNTTRSMRSKEEAHDYRYFPDPDLLPLKLNKDLIDKLKKELPELPDQKKDRFIKDHNLSPYEANILVSEKEISDYYEEMIKECDKKLATNWITVELFAVLNKNNLSISQSPISAKNLSSLVKMITLGKISGKIAKDVFEKMQVSDKDPKQIVEEEGLVQQSDPKELEKIVLEVLSKNQDKVIQYQSGKVKLFGYFVGEVMKVSKGKANPNLVNDILKIKLK